ncbi:cysteine--tRNA ligase [Candidatus Woesebacteria bacterium GWB1_43_5]|uniref:Cysteine--tRNA ligase n=1 Tax=Candidatus Woesebacteria bacterium GWB1_43_5 TaxID=1802474 RepID=A0A1F7WSD1_9BACT|nr:MAG: cysteine--tRNA ligase [Candidatus Woesebacteria bacterium GWB1_43_5]
MVDIYLTNSLTRKKEKFVPLRQGLRLSSAERPQGKPIEVDMYTCGITAYDHAHIGHGRKYVNDDLLRRVLTMAGFKVKHVQNVTDVGHLVSDADEGEDKLEKGAKKTGKTVWETAEFFSKSFYDSMDKLNILRPSIICRATEHIKEQINLIEKIIANGFAYDAAEAVYFDVARFKNYGALFGQKLEEKRVGVREDVKRGESKKHPADFALWFKRVGRFADHTMHWGSPWGDGFPGWHIECSAMSIKYLGEQFDIHTGGEDHLSIHHPNEIAQSEAATGKSPFVKYWIHYAFLTIDGAKMSKSLGNYYTVEDVVKKGYDPLALRYFYLTAHYKKPLNFTWEALGGAQTALNKLRVYALSLKSEKERTVLSEEKQKKIDEYRESFLKAVSDDLNMPRALAVVWGLLKSNIPSRDKYDLLINFDEVLGLGLSTVSPIEVKIPPKIASLMKERNDLRKRGKFADADKIRLEIEKAGFVVRDTLV